MYTHFYYTYILFLFFFSKHWTKDHLVKTSVLSNHSAWSSSALYWEFQLHVKVKDMHLKKTQI